MTAFRLFLVTIIVVIVAYTVPVIAKHGLNLLPVFFGDMAKMGWPGQFNLDFFCFLLLSGLWVAWRNQWRPVGLVLGLVAVFGGAPFLCAYLLVESVRTQGQVAPLLLGPDRARALVQSREA